MISMNKVHNTPWLLFCLVSFFFLSCNDEGLEGEFGEIIEEEEIEDPNEFAVFEVELDGQLFVATSILAISGEDGLRIEASNGNRKFSVLLPNPFQNNFSLNPSAGQVFMSYQPSTPANTGGEIFIAQSGSFNVTNFSDELNIISGTFAGSLQEAIFQDSGIQMTNGIFQDIVFFNENEIDPQNPNNTFMTASIDQTFFNASQVSIAISGESATLTGIQANRIIEISFLLSEGVGEYSLATEGFSATYLIDGNPQQATGGSITLTTIQENYIEGSYEFTTAESTIQSGDFGVVLN
jgi:hypothetical protein